MWAVEPWHLFLAGCQCCACVALSMCPMWAWDPSTDTNSHRTDVLSTTHLPPPTPAWQVLDEAKRVLNDPSAEPSERDRPPVGTKRTLRLLLDPSQYQRDLEAGNVGLYDKFNVVVRGGQCV